VYGSVSVGVAATAGERQANCWHRALPVEAYPMPRPADSIPTRRPLRGMSRPAHAAEPCHCGGPRPAWTSPRRSRDVNRRQDKTDRVDRDRRTLGNRR
jgi:hypothetical protein